MESSKAKSLLSTTSLYYPRCSSSVCIGFKMSTGLSALTVRLQRLSNVLSILQCRQAGRQAGGKLSSKYINKNVLAPTAHDLERKEKKRGELLSCWKANRSRQEAGKVSL